MSIYFIASLGERDLISILNHTFAFIRTDFDKGILEYVLKIFPLRFMSSSNGQELNLGDG